MAFVNAHGDQNVVVSDIFADLTRDPRYEKGVISDQYARYPPNETQATYGVFNFESSLNFQVADRANWLHWPRAYFKIRGKSVDQNGVALTDAANAHGTAFANGGWCLFKDATVNYGGKTLHSTKRTNLVHYMTLIKNMAMYSEDYIKTMGTAQGLFPDTGAGGLDIKPTTTPLPTADTAAAVKAALDLQTVNADYNEGYDKRRSLHHLSGEVSMILPLSDVVPLFQEYNFALRGQQMEIKLERNAKWEEMYQCVVGTHKARFQLLDVELWVPIIRPDIITEGVAKGLITTEAQQRLSWTDTSVWALPASTATDISWNPGDIKAPVRATFAMVDDAARNTYLGSATIFKPFGLTEFRIACGSGNYPETELKSNGSDYARFYHDFMELYGKKSPVGVERGGYIDYARFKSLYFLPTIDLSKRKVNSDDSDVAQRLDITAKVEATAKTLILMVDHTKSIVLKGLGDAFEFTDN